jgi:hypothetical protein
VGEGAFVREKKTGWRTWGGLTRSKAGLVKSARTSCSCISDQDS